MNPPKGQTPQGDYFFVKKGKMAKYNLPKPKDLLDAGVHFGHQVRRWHPSMEPYIYSVKKNLHIIDLEHTEKGLKEACEFLYNTAANGGQIIFVGTKKQAREIVEIEAKRSGALFVTERWLGGTITNFDVIKKKMKRLVDLTRKREQGELNHYTKKERLLIDREIEKLQNSVGGLVGMRSIPAALVVIDAKREKTAIKEAHNANSKIIGLVDTNTNPEKIDIVIPGNDDAIKSIAIIVKALADAVEAGYKEYAKKGASAGTEQTPEENVEEEGMKVSSTKSPVSSETAGKKLVERVNKGEDIVDTSEIEPEDSEMARLTEENQE